MLETQQVDLTNKAQVRRFLHLPFRLYQGHPLWVPPMLLDAKTQLDPSRHPFYDHSEAEFFLVHRDGQDVGRIAVLHNRPYNNHHGARQAQFYLFECEEDFEAAQALFERASAWAHERGLTQLVGPKGFGALDGYGMLVEGYHHRPAMTMMNYNPPYYPEFMQALGFGKEVDFVSCYLGVKKFQLPDRVHRIAERAAQRSGLQVLQFKDKRELRRWAPKIGRTYNQTFVDNWEYYPLNEREIAFLTDNLLTVADPKLIKIIVQGEEVVGFLFAFPDVSAAIQRSKGRLLPFGLLDLLKEFRRTEWVALNGAGILPAYQGRGGNALLYAEMERTLRISGFQHADLTQVAESAVQMRRDLESLGGVPYKSHRVFIREV